MESAGFLRRGNQGSLRADAVYHVFQFGEQVDTPVAGDWNGDGIDQIAVFRGVQWDLDQLGSNKVKGITTTLFEHGLLSLLEHDFRPKN
ncbi:hypothetical protein Q31b_31790 [Novipirellula aureliae]|uniref:FG-GAP repeat protein n=2 Tax=Novipirellula aureliae TaxID=2527966 RepID=A0A5C6DUE2_9BACT|nr:hypothetical protein Q31b_31790 [Novipirellula aureliae]